jgi:uncharacterized coiled-coil protein SlyX
MESYPVATLESVWAAFRETDRQIKENIRSLTEKQAETDRQIKEYSRSLTEKQAETDRQLKESGAAFDRRMKKMDEQVGSWSNNHGAFAQEYFFNSFENGRNNFFGEKFDDIEEEVKGIEKGFKDEYDILMINGEAVGIVEVKYKAHENDIPKVLRKAQTIRVNFPKFKNHKVYLGLATMAFYPELEEACIKNGIAVVKQMGDTVVINDEHLKAF